MQNIKIKAADLKFFEELDAHVALGRPAYEFAAERGIASGTVSYRLNSLSLEMVRAEGLRHKFTGRMFRQMVEAGEYQVTDAEAAAPEPAGAAA